MSQVETRMWFTYLCERYIDIGIEAIHPNGYLQMPGSRTLAAPVGEIHWYWANNTSDAVPSGFNQEDTIKEIWATDR